jgi:hypothetical protein
MKLTELFNTKPKYEITKDNIYTTYETSIGEDDIEVDFGFFEENGSSYSTISFTVNGVHYLTHNNKNQFIIFATVSDIIKDYVGKEKPDYLNFSAYEQKRANLYKKFIDKYAKSFGYKLVKEDKVEYGHFTLKRI